MTPVLLPTRSRTKTGDGRIFRSVGVEQVGYIVGLGDERCDALFDQFVRAVAGGAGNGAGYRADAAAKTVSGEHGCKRPGPHASLRDHDPTGERRHQAAPPDEPVPAGCSSRR